MLSDCWFLQTERRKQYGRHFPADIFKYIFLNENVYILVQMSLRLGPDKGPVPNTPVLVQTMAWYRIGDKPLFEPMTTKFSDVTSSQWVNNIHRYSWNFTFLTLFWNSLVKSLFLTTSIISLAEWCGETSSSLVMIRYRRWKDKIRWDKKGH